MGRGLRVGTVVGAPVILSPWWFVVAAVLTLWIAPFYRDWYPELGDTGAYLLAGAFVAILYVSAFLHELGHAFSARGFGLRVHQIQLTAIGGFTQMDVPATPARSAVTAFAGPAVNLVLMLIGLGALVVLDGGLPQAFAAQVALTNGLVAALNLLPGLPLDGGSIVRAGVWAVTGKPRTGTIVTAWIGRALAVAAAWWSVTLLLRGGSLLTPLWGLFIAYWLWSSAGAALAGERVRAAVPQLTARGLARSAVPVLADEPVSTVVARMEAAGARAAIVTDPTGRPTGVVSQAALAAAPEDRRPWLSAGTLARRIEPSLILDADLAGEPLVARLLDAPASEYLVQDGDGRILGVLVFADVEAALGRR